MSTYPAHHSLARRLSGVASAMALAAAAFTAFAPPSTAGDSPLRGAAYVEQSEGCSLSNFEAGVPMQFATAFVATASGAMTSVTVDTEFSAGPASDVPIVGVWTDAGGRPNTLLAGNERTPSTTRIPPADATGFQYGAEYGWRTFALTSTGAGDLVAGQPYWLAVQTPADLWFMFGNCEQDATGPIVLYREDGGPWTEFAGHMDADGETPASDYAIVYRIAGSIELGTTPQSVSGVVGTAITPTTPFGSGWTAPRFTVPDGLPDGLSMEISSGVVSGSPTTEGTATDFAVHVTGYDANQDPVSTETALSIAVTAQVPDAPAPAPQPPLAPSAGSDPAPVPAEAPSVMATPVATPAATPIPVQAPAIPTPSAVSAADMHSWSPDQVSRIDAGVFGQVDPEVIAAISPQQAAMLSFDQLSNIRPLGAAGLQAATVLAMDAGQLSGLRPAAVGSLNPLDICVPVGEACVLGENGLTAQQMAGFRPEAFAHLQSAQFEVIRPEQVSDLSTDAINQIRARGAAALQPDTVAALSNRQLTALRPAAVGALDPAAIALLSPDQVASLRPGGVARMTTAQLRALSPSQIAAMSPRQLAALSPAQRRLLS